MSFFKSPQFRALLVFLALILLGLAVWFLGPYLALGDLHPMESVASRVTVIVLLLALAIFFLLGFTLVPIGIACLALLIWHAGPLLAFGKFQPLASETVRWIVIAVLVLVYAIYGIFKLYMLIRNDKAFADKLFRHEKATQVVAKEEIAALRTKAKTAERQLKQMHLTMAGGTGTLWAMFKRLFEGKRYLYELPWYMIIGAPSAGKTSALLNAGLKFPMAEQMGAVGAQLALTQKAGTANCGWWFTNEAVLIDTAGRYTRPDDGQNHLSEEEVADPQALASDAAKQQEALNKAEWNGFLGILRTMRGRAPINGALLTVDLSALLSDDETERLAHAAQMRARLSELRQQLGIRFPVYVMVTKSDLLSGFTAYFNSLTSEARAQAWGFTLPWQDQADKGMVKKLAQRSLKAAKNAGQMVGAVAEDEAPANTDQAAQAHWPLARQIAHELRALHARIADGVNNRLQEEYEPDARQALYLLAPEFEALIPRLAQMIDAVFADSRFDTTQIKHMLRGVYFTSAKQYDQAHVVSDHQAIVPRLRNALRQWVQGGSEQARPDTSGHPTSMRSYFFTDVLSRVVFAEAHLVKPNLKWEARIKLLRLLGHALVVFLFIWLAGGMTVSQRNNAAYLADVKEKTNTLTQSLQTAIAAPKAEQMVDVLGQSQVLPAYTGLNLRQPSGLFTYGLYTAEPVVASSDKIYAHLQDSLVLPVLIQRMEFVMRDAVTRGDSKLAYQTLRAYLLLHDADMFTQAANTPETIRSWVTADWQGDHSPKVDTAPVETANAKTTGTNKAPATPTTDSRNATSAGLSTDLPGGHSLVETFNNSAAMIGHIESMFNGARVVQSGTARNEQLVRTVRAFLEKNSSSQRLYERAKDALKPLAPKDFSLVKVVGPQAGTLFRMASGQSVEDGVPGLFTYDGYHQLFAAKLPEIVAEARGDDDWVMGRNQRNDPALNFSAPRDNSTEIKALTEEIRRQYLRDYTNEWSRFLEDVRLVSAGGGESLAFELNALRQLAAPDSPLIKLVKDAAVQTTLSKALILDPKEAKAAEKAVDALAGVTIRPEAATERELVDERFAGLHEVVAGGGGLGGVSNILNSYYTVLVVADSALSSNNLPAAGSEDAATALTIEAGKMPVPLKQVMLDIANTGSIKVANGAAKILRTQAETQLNALIGFMTVQVSEPCRRGLAGRYPFAQSTQDASIEDFNALFGAQGAADEYFTKFLEAYVDTTSRPWRYKNPEAVQLLENAEALALGKPTSRGPTIKGELLKLLAQRGPEPDAFAQIKQVREMFFRGDGGKRLEVNMDLKVQTLDPSVTELLVDIDGQAIRYAHGPVSPLKAQWPGPKGGTRSELTAYPRIGLESSSAVATGPWALMRMLSKGKLIPSTNPARAAVEYSFDGRRAVLDITTQGVNPFTSDLLKTFKCPTVRG